MMFLLNDLSHNGISISISSDIHISSLLCRKRKERARPNNTLMSLIQAVHKDIIVISLLILLVFVQEEGSLSSTSNQVAIIRRQAQGSNGHLSSRKFVHQSTRRLVPDVNGNILRNLALEGMNQHR